MKAPLPEKLNPHLAVLWQVVNALNDYHDYLAELSEVVDGKQDKFTLKESMFGENSPAGAGMPGTSGTNQQMPTLKERLLGEIRLLESGRGGGNPESFGTGFLEAKKRIEEIVNRLIP